MDFSAAIVLVGRGVLTAFEVFWVFFARCDVEEYGNSEFCFGNICGRA